MYACSNLKAIAFSIPTEDFFKSLTSVNKIAPQTSHTASVVTGLGMLELMRFAYEKQTGEKLPNLARSAGVEVQGCILNYINEDAVETEESCIPSDTTEWSMISVDK